MYTFARYSLLVLAAAVVCGILVTQSQDWTHVFGKGMLIAATGYAAFKLIPNRFQLTMLAAVIAFVLIGAPVLHIIGSYVEPIPFIEFGDYAFSKVSNFLYAHAQVYIDLSGEPVYCRALDADQERRELIGAVCIAIISIGATAGIELHHFKALHSPESTREN